MKNHNLLWISNPFHRVAGTQALIIGLIGIIIAAYICHVAGIHFDGVIDAHYGSAPSFLQAIAEGIINLVVLVIVLLPFYYMIGKPGIRVLDLIGTQAFARLPFVVMAASMWAGKPLGMEEIGHALAAGKIPDVSETLTMLGFSIIAFAVVGLMIYWMYRAFAHCSGSGGKKAIVTFSIALLISEIGSKWLVVQLALAINAGKFPWLA